MANGTPGDDKFSNEDAENYGFDGNDIIVSKLLSGTAYMEGGNGNDTLTMGDGGSARLEARGGDGDDWLRGNDGYDFFFGDTGSDLLESGAGTDHLYGGSGIDGLYGSDGVDALYGDDGDDDNVLVTITPQGGTISFHGGLYGGAGNDRLDGGAGNDWLDGGVGNDRLDGGIGDDKLYGGMGDDSYLVDSADDRVFENAGEGDDWLSASTSYVLAPGQEIEYLVARVASIELTGNEFGQRMYCGDGFNVLRGEGGRDTLHGDRGDQLYGGAGDDVYVVPMSFGTPRISEDAGEGHDVVNIHRARFVLLAGAEIEVLMGVKSPGLGAPDFMLAGNAFAQSIIGNEGNDVLSDGGGAGIDTLQGWNGDDTYRIGNSGAVIVELIFRGSDTVQALVDYALKAGVEVEVMRANSSASKAGIDLTGNAFVQTITGNAGANILSDGGGAGIDTLQGLGGSDTYRVGNSGAVIVEAAGGGSDTVLASVGYALKAGVEVEMLRTTLETGTNAINLTGNELKQAIRGNAGSNMLDGKGGNDLLQGLGGKDFFTFSTALRSNNIDKIIDFDVADDTVRLHNAIFTKLTATGGLSASLFRSNSSGTAEDADDFVLYDTDNGRLYYDADGNGAGQRIHFATLTGAPAVTAADFEVA